MSTDIKMTKKRALSIANLSNQLVSELKQYAEKTEGDLPEWLQAKIEQAYQLILSAYGTLQAEELEKALGHKYKKRVPYTNSKGKKAWKYFYEVAESLKGKTAFDDTHLVEGAKFQVVSAKGKEVHAHITKVVGEMVTYVLDDGEQKGKVITKTKSEIIKDMDKEHKIVDTLKQKVKEKRANVKQAEQTGTAKQIQRLQEQADRLQTAINKFRGANNLAREENNFETMPEVEAVDNFETMPEVEAQPSSFLSDEELDKKSIEELVELKSQESARGDALSKLMYKEHDEKALDFPEQKELDKIQAELRKVFQRMEEAEENNDEIEMLNLESEEYEKQEEVSVLRDKIRKRKDDLYKELAKKYKRDESDAYYNKLADLVSKKIKEKNEAGEPERQAKKEAEKQAKREAEKQAKREVESQKNQDENVPRLIYGGKAFFEYTKEGFAVLKNEIESELGADKRTLKNLEKKAELYSPNIPYELGNLIRNLKNSILTNTRNMARIENFEKRHNFETMPEVEKPFEEKFKVGRQSLSVYDILKNRALKRTDKSSFDVMNHLELMSEKVVKASIELLKEQGIKDFKEGLENIRSAFNLPTLVTSQSNSEILSKILQNVEYKENTTIAELAQKIAELVTGIKASKKAKKLEEEVDRAVRSAKSQAEFEPRRKELVIDRAKLLVKNDIIRRNIEKERSQDISKEEIGQLVHQRDQFLSKKLNRILKNIEKSKNNKIDAVRSLRKEEEKAKKAIDRYYKKQKFSELVIDEQEVSMNIKGENRLEKRWVLELPKKRSDIVVSVNDNESYLNVTCTVEGSPFNGLKLFDMPIITNLLSTPEGQEILKDIADLPSIPKTQEQLSKVKEELSAKMEMITAKGEDLRNHPIHESTAIVTSIRLLNEKIVKDVDKQVEEQINLRKLDTAEGARQELISRGEEVVAFSDSPDLASDEIIPLSNQLVYYLQNFNAVYAKHKREKDTSFGDLTVLRKLVALLRSASESLTPNTKKKSDLEATIKIFIDDIKNNKNLSNFAFQAFRERVESAKRILGVASIPPEQQDDSENFETMPEEVEQENNFETMPEVEAQPTQELPANKTKAHQFASLRKKDLQERLGKLSVAELIRMAKDNNQNKIDFKEKIDLTPRVKRLQKELEEAKRQYQRAKDNNFGANDEKATVNRKTDQLIDARERAYKSAGDFTGLGVALNRELTKRAGGDKDKLLQYMEEISDVNKDVETKTNLYVARERLDRLLSETKTSGENSSTNPDSALPSVYDVKESVSTVEGRGKALNIWYNGRLYNEVLKIIDRGDSSGLKDLIEEFKNANELLAKQGISFLDRDMIPVLRDAGTPTGSKSKEANAEYDKFKTEYLGKISKLVDETNVPSDVQIIEYFRDKTLARLEGSYKQQAQDFLNAQIEKRKADSKPARKTAREELEESALTTPEGLTEEQAKKYRDQDILNEAQIKEVGSKLEIEENKKIHEPKGKLKNADSLNKKQKALFDKLFNIQDSSLLNNKITDTGLLYSTDKNMIVMANLEEFEPSINNKFSESFLRESVSVPEKDREQIASFNAKTVKILNKKIKAIVKGTKAKKTYDILELSPNESTGALEIFIGSREGKAEPVLIASVDTGDSRPYSQAIRLKHFRKLLDLGEEFTISQKSKLKSSSQDLTPLHFGTDSLEGAIMPLRIY